MSKISQTSVASGPSILSAEEAGVLKAKAFEKALAAAMQTVTSGAPKTPEEERAMEIEHDRQYARTLISTYLAALPDVEPAGWRVPHCQPDGYYLVHDKPEGVIAEPLFTHPASEGCPKGWQPIETAPKDGSEILLYGEPNEVPELKPHIAAGHWRSTAGIMAPGIWCWRHSVGPSFKITKWQPLPAAPSIPEGE